MKSYGTIKQITIFILIVLPAVVCAANEDFETWLDRFKQDALTQGVSKQTVDKALTGLQPLPRIIQLDHNQPETKKTLEQYLSGAINDLRVRKGRKLLQQHASLLNSIYQRYKVPPRYIIALWAIETDFGRNVGKLPVINSLATLAWDDRRSRYFRNELLNALRMIDTGAVSLDQMRGSWAGAMGQVQFMPTTFLAYAVDGNGDRHIDIWDTEADYLNSAANYLAKSGWVDRQLWGREIQLTAKFKPPQAPIDQKRTIAQWQKLGVRKISGLDLPQVEMMASLVQPDGTEGRSFLAYNNYHILLKWNRSHKFAIAVGMLADKISSRR